MATMQSDCRTCINGLKDNMLGTVTCALVSYWYAPINGCKKWEQEMMQSDEKNLPTEPGWYFAKFKHASQSKIECYKIFENSGELFIAVEREEQFGEIAYFRVDAFQWFGKVSMPVEID